ncbi:MAG: hypothetical protein AMJ59_05445 [Gammaproteobacteria bacterium SG8_31]|jgi:uncharacterized membrane protein YkvA (DUF1232 family)|nr:MAG: hypothetical protein AMJ59_05445 [Gammaproteobacteria bacterium SG8_31]
MAMRVSFEISDRDLSHFRECMQRARDAVRDAEDTDIIEAAEQLFEEVNGAKAPAFVTDRLQRLESMVNMLRDDEWALPSTQRNRVLCALVYFCDPEDLIPDSIPGLGYLDDAIMIELVFRELRHEIEAYDDFVQWRASSDKRFRINRDPVARDKRIAVKRKKLFERIQRRKAKDAQEEAKAKKPGLF